MANGEATNVKIIQRTMPRRFWPGQNPIGARTRDGRGEGAATRAPRKLLTD